MLLTNCSYFYNDHIGKITNIKHTNTKGYSMMFDKLCVIAIDIRNNFQPNFTLENLYFFYNYDF